MTADREERIRGFDLDDQLGWSSGLEIRDELLNEIDDLRKALRRIEAGCAFPADEVQKTIRDVARDAIAQSEGKPFVSKVLAVIL